MNSVQAMDLMHEALTTGFILMIIPVGAALAVGVVVGLLQAVTQLQDPSISFVPKALVLTALLFWLGPWLFQILTQFVIRLWTGGMGV